MKKGSVYTSLDKRYSVQLAEDIIGELLRHISAAKNKETGGILIGSYNDLHDLALISRVTGAPVDSKSGTTWFYRGIKNLQDKINNLWNEKQYYLGEWHYHPFASAIPSITDIDQMKKISKDKKYSCPEPILLIIGGSTQTYEIRIFVFPRDDKKMELFSSLSMPL